MKEKDELLRSKSVNISESKKEDLKRVNSFTNPYDPMLYNGEKTDQKDEKDIEIDELIDRLQDHVPEIMDSKVAMEIRNRMEEEKSASKDLFDSHLFFGDSSLMKAVKIAVRESDEAFYENHDRPLTVEDIDSVIKKMDVAILACKDYILQKTSDSDRAKERRRVVYKSMEKLLNDSANLICARELILDQKLGDTYNSGRELVLGVRYKRVAGMQKPGEHVIREKPGQEKLEKLGTQGAILYRILSGGDTISGAIEKLKKSEDKKEREFADQLPGLLMHLRENLGRISEGKYGAVTIAVGSNVFTFAQSDAGQLTFYAGTQSVPIERDGGVLFDVLSMDMVRNDSVYGDNAGTNIIKKAVKDLDPSRPLSYMQSAELMAAYLSKNTGRNISDFKNVEPASLAFLCSMIYNGTFKGTKEDLEMIDDLLAEAREGMINSESSREKIRTLKNTDEFLLEDRVRIEKKNENIAGDIREGEIPWTPEEEKIRTLFADLVFSQDTWVTDELKAKPADQIRQTLIKNKEALAILLADIFKTGNTKFQVLDAIIDRLPMSLLGEGKGDNGEAYAKSLDGYVKQLKTALSLATMKIAGYYVSAGEDTKSTGDENAFVKKVKELKKHGDVTKKLSDINFILTGGEIDGVKYPPVDEIISTKVEEEYFNKAAEMIDEGVESSLTEIQKTIVASSNELFTAKPVKEKKKRKKPKDPNEAGVSEEEKAKRIKIKREYDKKQLKEYVEEAMTGGSGQGLFTKLIFQNYFEMVSLMDKRAMIASMIRSAKPAQKLLDVTDKKLQKDEIGAREEINEKRKAAALGNYLGGLLKGAGPLFQKILQGFPDAGMPEELKGAMSDMKSRLSPIPEEVVKAELLSMVERSHGQVKNITVKKALGSASVAQTFLCVLKNADGSEQEVAIKLLKPDVKNRMEREKKILLDCARMTDMKMRENAGIPGENVQDKGGMERTFEGQLRRIEEEMDFTIEAKNIELGGIYNSEDKQWYDKVKTMKINTSIAPTSNSMVLDRAPGENYFELMERIEKEVDELVDDFKIRGNMGEILYDGKGRPQVDLSPDTYLRQHGVGPNSPDYGTKWDECMELLKPVRKKLYDLLGELKTKKKYLETFAEKWAEEGIFKEGFYHGDPHAGNIMVSDEGLTVIDFGNCTNMEKGEQESVIRLMQSAFVDDVEEYRHNFHALLDPKFETQYQALRDKLGEEFTKIFAMGDHMTTGLKIMATLLRAQEMGFEMPAAIYNFCQGQLRLSNTLDDMNTLIEKLEEYESMSNLAALDQIEKFDALGIFIDRMEEPAFDWPRCIDAMLFFTNRKSDFIKALSKGYNLTATETNLEMYFSGTIEEAGPVLKTMKTLASKCKGKTIDVRNLKEVKAQTNAAFEKMVKVIGPDIRDEFLALLEAETIDENALKVVYKKLEGCKANAEKMRKLFAEFKKEMIEIDSKEEVMPEGTKKKLNELADGIFPMIQANHRYGSTLRGTFSHMLERESDTQANHEQVNKEREDKIIGFFKANPYRSDEFMKKRTEYFDAQNAKDDAKAEEIKEELFEIYRDIMSERISNMEKRTGEAALNVNEDFVSIVGKVINKHTWTSMWTMGLYKSISYYMKTKDMAV